MALIQRHAGQPLALTVQRGADRLTLTVVPRAESVQGQEVGRIGVQLGGDIPMVTVRYGVIDSVWRGVQRTWDTAWLSLRMMGRMVLGRSPGAISAARSRSPIMPARRPGSA